MAQVSIILLIAALLSAGAAAWVLRAYRRAPGGDEARPWPAFIAAAILGVGAFALYVAIGRPDLPGAAYAPRVEALAERPIEGLSGEEMLALLAERARDNPSEAEPHLYSGQVYLRFDRPEQAARAFDAALRRNPDLGEAQLGLGRALVQMGQGQVSDDAARAFARASELLPDEPTPWLYLIMHAMQSQRDEDARRFAGEALARMSEDDPRRQMAEQLIAGAREEVR